ncbi:MAG: hypothetical protein BJ554DRAFT_8222, partial [Olpidium bornovanus]
MSGGGKPGTWAVVTFGRACCALSEEPFSGPRRPRPPLSKNPPLSASQHIGAQELRRGEVPAGRVLGPAADDPRNLRLLEPRATRRGQMTAPVGSRLETSERAPICTRSGDSAAKSITAYLFSGIWRSFTLSDGHLSHPRGVCGGAGGMASAVVTASGVGARRHRTVGSRVEVVAPLRRHSRHPRTLSLKKPSHPREVDDVRGRPRRGRATQSRPFGAARRATATNPPHAGERETIRRRGNPGNALNAAETPLGSG